MLAKTYVLQDDSHTVAYVSLLTDKIAQTSVPKNLWRRLRKSIPHEKHFNSYPAVKIGRLAVSLQNKGEGIGSRIIEAMKIKLAVSPAQIAACRFLTIDAYHKAVPFYEKNNFRLLTNDVPEDAPTVPMYFDLMTIAEQ